MFVDEPKVHGGAQHRREAGVEGQAVGGEVDGSICTAQYKLGMRLYSEIWLMGTCVPRRVKDAFVQQNLVDGHVCTTERVKDAFVQQKMVDGYVWTATKR